MRPAGHHAVRGLHGPGQGLESFFEFADSTRALIQFVSQPAAKREVRRDVTEYVITVRNEMMRDRFRSVPRTTNGAKKSATKKDTFKHRLRLSPARLKRLPSCLRWPLGPQWLLSADSANQRSVYGIENRGGHVSAVAESSRIRQDSAFFCRTRIRSQKFFEKSDPESFFKLLAVTGVCVV